MTDANDTMEMSGGSAAPAAMSGAAGHGLVATGVPGLDALLGGGLLPRRTALIKGAPGSGKTTLGLQILVAGATQFAEPGVLVSFEQRPEQLYEDAARFGWDLPALAADRRLTPIFVTPEQVLQNEGRQAHQLLVELSDLVEDHGARRLLIDSISHLSPMLAGGGQARANLLKFLNALKALGLTPLLTSELAGGAEDLMGLEAYLVDTILVLDQAGVAPGSGPASGRTIQVYKGRGLAHLPGRHPMEISPAGVAIYPHSYPSEGAEISSAAPSVAASPGAPIAPIPSGIAGLDDLLGGGYAPGSAILVAGLSGTFKTTVAARFLMAEPGAPGVLISFQETRDALARRFGAEALGEGGPVAVIEAIPGRQPVEKIFAQAAGRLAATGARRVVIDGLGDLAAGAPGQDEAAREEAARWFLRNMRAQGVTTLATQQISRLTGRNPMTAIALPDLADTIIYLGLVEIESRLEHVISVLKHRGGPALGDLRAVAPAGGAELLSVSDRFVGLSGVLSGTPLGRRKAQIEEIFQPLYFIRDFLALARDPAADPAQREAILANLSSETQRLLDLLGKHFDQPAAGGEKDKSQ